MNKIKGKFIFNFSRDLLLVLVVACFAFSFLFASQAQAFSDSDCDSGDLTTTCTVTSTKILSAGEVISGDNLVIDSSGELTTGYNSDNHYYNSFQINMSGDVTLQNGGVITGNVEINTDNLNIASSSAIDVSDKGYAGGERVCGGSSGGSSGYGAGAGGAGNEISGGGGAGYGGLGGNGFNSSDGGSVYGQASTTDPFSYGSGGGSGGISEGGDDQCSGAGGAGGGLVKIVASSSLVLNGNIWANGEDGKNGSSSVAQGGGGGSGGSVWIETPSVSGTGSIQAEGGNGGDGDISPSGGGGAGGRIALGKSPIFSSLTVSSDAGSGYEAGERGSLYYDFSGTYTSEVLDFSSPRDFTTINISKTEPATNTSVTVYLRAGSTTTPDESWTDWMEVSDGSDISSTSDNRYLQYKTELSLQATGTIPQNLSLDSINISYNSYNITTVTDWARRVKIGIDPDKVDGDLNSFPLLLTEDNLPAEIFNRAQADACDLRFSTDSALDNELAFEIVSFDSASSTAEIWVKIPSLSSSATTSFYAWYGNNSAQCYASSSTYGSQNVWSDKYVGVWHLGDDSASTTDSSPNNNGGECYNTDDWYDTCPALIEGKIGKAHYWDNNQEDQIDIPNSDSFNVDSLSVQLWAKVETTTDEYQILLSKDNIWGMGVDYENKAGWGTEYSLLLGNEVSNSDFDFFVGTYDTPSIQKFYQNGVEVASDTYPPTSLSNNSSDFVLGGGEFPYSLPEGDNRNFYGTMDEVRVLN
ncbi:MAG TPA: DUF2341 domain-containing protein, partial [Patescibacteria group bacterium]|nr:DUF2341 domain-containing protein [Patescibacteria group bacterium]